MIFFTAVDLILNDIPSMSVNELCACLFIEILWSQYYLKYNFCKCVRVFILLINTNNKKILEYFHVIMFLTVHMLKVTKHTVKKYAFTQKYM